MYSGLVFIHKINVIGLVVCFVLFLLLHRRIIIAQCLSSPFFQSAVDKSSHQSVLLSRFTDISLLLEIVSIDMMFSAVTENGQQSMTSDSFVQELMREHGHALEDMGPFQSDTEYMKLSELKYTLKRCGLGCCISYIGACNVSNDACINYLFWLILYTMYSTVFEQTCL